VLSGQGVLLLVLELEYVLVPQGLGTDNDSSIISWI